MVLFFCHRTERALKFSADAEQLFVSHAITKGSESLKAAEVLRTNEAHVTLRNAESSKQHMYCWLNPHLKCVCVCQGREVLLVTVIRAAGRGLSSDMILSWLALSASTWPELIYNTIQFFDEIQFYFCGCSHYNLNATTIALSVWTVYSTQVTHTSKRRRHAVFMEVNMDPAFSSTELT